MKPEWFNESVGLSCWHFKYNMVFDYNFYHETTTIYKQLQCLQNQKSGTNKKVQMKPCSCMTRCGTTVYMTVFSHAIITGNSNWFHIHCLDLLCCISGSSSLSQVIARDVFSTCAGQTVSRIGKTSTVTTANRQQL